MQEKDKRNHKSILVNVLCIPYIANHLRWKSFAVAEVHFNLLEIKHSQLDGSLVRPTAQAISPAGKVSQYQSIYEN